MTRDQLDAIRARVKAATPGPWRASRWPSNNPGITEAWGLSGMVTFADATFCGHAREDVPALLAEVERLKVEVERLTAELDMEDGNLQVAVQRLTTEVVAKTKQNVALIGQNGRLQQEVERLTAERDELIRWREGWLAVDEMCESVAIAAAFKRGVAAMREAAVDACRPEHPDAVRRLRALPDPEDKS